MLRVAKIARVAIPCANVLSARHARVAKLEHENEVTNLYNLCANSILKSKSWLCCEIQLPKPPQPGIVESLEIAMQKKGYTVKFVQNDWYCIIEIREHIAKPSHKSLHSPYMKHWSQWAQ